MSRWIWIVALWLGAVTAGCNQDVLPPPPSDAAADATLVPQPVTCSSKASTRTCAAGELCAWFEGGGVDCRPLPANCVANPTCACKPPLPNGTCTCKDDGAGRILVECH